MTETDISLGPSRLPASKQQIREHLRKTYDKAGNDPPNVNRAWADIHPTLPNTTRARVREVLKEAEFARRRRPPGKRR
jgi:hypothetical protein